ARATPKRHYYLQSFRGNRLFELGLGPIALTFCGASDPESQTLIDRLLAEHGPDGFAEAYLRAKNLEWAADLLARLLAAPAKAPSLRQELRSRGVAAFGLAA
ncbi:MAG: hypothetical protein J0I07_25755, partial [Myxococcales bacterium]|nr:hypothetical protein [Myxococcales bacterium]